MLLRKIFFKNFRSFQEKSFEFNPFLTIVFGENAKGKTNLLEGIYFLLNGTGFREEKEKELIFFGKDESYLEGEFYEGEVKTTFSLYLKNDGLKKGYFINRSKKNQIFYQKEIPKTVLFTPSQIEIITGSPEKRRNYFDKLISFYDLEYKKRLINYEKALYKRNRILEGFQDEKKLIEEIVFWNDYLKEQAAYISKKRADYVNYLNQHPKIDKKNFFIFYQKNEFNQERLVKVFSKEKEYRKTLIGPQKDDFQISLEEKEVGHFGSRSEQRLAIFWLKINEIRFFEESYGKKPIILLDDIFSELDFKNKKLIFNLIEKYQTIVTTTELEVLQLVNVLKSVIKL
ncbi:MAG: DNA replication and repair protein RecF [Patescibacteria group bacterium]|nr:DNA replication and repair protein RecF [Patescibacteria group bacterium]